jgi:glycosyltransferase involved in cell wall biosynthesis
MSRLESEVITVGITTFERTDLLIETLHSVLSQSHSNIRIIVANDNPSQQLTSHKLGLGGEERLQVVNHARNLGEMKNLNWLMNACDTKWFTWLADDDVMHPKYLELLLSATAGQENCQVVYSSYAHGSHIDETFFTDIGATIFEKMESVDFLKRYSARSISLLGNYGLFDISALREAGGFRHLGSGFSPYGDTLIPFMLAKGRPIFYCMNELVFLRTHEKSISTYSESLEAYSSAEVDFVKYCEDSLTQSSKNDKREIYGNLQRWFLENRQSVIARNKSTSILSLFLEILVSYLSFFRLFYSRNLILKIFISDLYKSLFTLFKKILRRTIYSINVKSK